MRPRPPHDRLRSSPRWPPLSAVLAMVVVLVLPASARAEHPAVLHAIELAEEADFGAALAAFEAAEARTDLGVQDVVALYAARALVRFAERDRAGLEADLRRWLALAPQGALLPSSAPPPVVALAESLRAQGVVRPSLSVRARMTPQGVRIAARVASDDLSLVRGVRIFARSAGGQWSVEDGTERLVAARAGDTVVFGAEAVGPGGAPIASAGTRETPRTLAIPTLSRGSSRLVSRVERRDGAPSTRGRRARGSFAWWAVGAGAGAAAAIGIVVALVATSPSGERERTALSGPTWSP